MKRNTKKLLLGIGIPVLCLVLLVDVLFGLLRFVPYYKYIPSPPQLVAQYESEQGVQTWQGYPSGRSFGNWLGKSTMSGIIGTNDPRYAKCFITVPPGTMLRFTNQAEGSQKRYHIGWAKIDLILFEERNNHPRDGEQYAHEGEVLNLYEFQFAAPETPGRYQMMVHVDFQSNGSAGYYYILDVQ